MDWFKKHVHTVVVLGGILTSIFWMNSKFNDLDQKMRCVDLRITKIETALVLKGIMFIDNPCFDMGYQLESE